MTAGATGWNYRTMLPFLKRSETAPGRNPAYRGTDGPMLVAPPADRHPLFEAFMAAALEAGHPYVDDYNGPDGEGVGWSETNVVAGSRQSAADARRREDGGAGRDSRR